MGLHKFWPICLSSILFAGVTFKPDPSLNKDDFTAVGKIQVNNAAGSCVIIRDGTWILTAKHVFKDNQGNLIPDPATTQITLGDCCFQVKEVYYHANYDLALCKLNGKFNIETAVISKTNLKEDDIIWATGYGASSASEDPKAIKYNSIYGNFAVISNRVDGAAFDRENIYYTYTPRLDDKAVPGEGIIGMGDSGGGVFAKNNNNFELVGINIGLGGTENNGVLIDGVGFFLPLQYCRTWINDTIIDNTPVPPFE